MDPTRDAEGAPVIFLFGFPEHRVIVSKVIQARLLGNKTLTTNYRKEKGMGILNKIMLATAVCGSCVSGMAAEKAAEKAVTTRPSRVPPPPMQKAAGPEIAAGDSVIHPMFGRGDVLSVTKMGADKLYEIAFDKVGTKKLMGSYVKMTKE